MQRGLLSTVVGIWMASVAAADAVKVELLEITETRTEKVKEEKPQSGGFMNFAMSGGSQEGLELKLELTGEAAGKATKWGQLKLATATLDNGETLALQERGFMGQEPTKGFVAIDRDQMYFGRDEEEVAEKLEIELPLEVTPRSATAIKQLRGALVLRIEQPKEVKVSGLTTQAKRVEDPALEAAGVPITVERAGPRQVAVKAARGSARVLDIAVVDGDGEDITSSTMWSSMNAAKEWTLSTNAAINAQTQVVITVAGEFEDVPVRFELRDVQLP